MTLDYINFNGTQIRKPEDFKPAREDVYGGDYTTCTGKTIADRIGWKFSDLTLSFSVLSQSEVDALVGLSGAFTFVFDDMDGDTQTEQCVRSSIVSLRHRGTVNGIIYWEDVEMAIKFLNVHS